MKGCDNYVSEHIKQLSTLTATASFYSSELKEVKDEFSEFRKERKADMIISRRWAIGLFVTLILGFSGLMWDSNRRFDNLYTNYNITPRSALSVDDTVVCERPSIAKGDH